MSSFQLLSNALCVGASTEIISALEAMSMTEEDELGWTPLFYCVASGNLHSVAKALSAGADPQHLDDSGWSASMLAAISGQRQVVKLLQSAVQTGSVDQDAADIHEGRGQKNCN